ncbi:unnamed protein product [Schistosoma haematobium]|nr:unnamed protein product [Schistosoma haematobium]
MIHSFVLLLNVLLLFLYDSTGNDLHMKRDMISNEIKDVKESIQQKIQSVRSHSNQINLIIKKKTKQAFDNSQPMNQYIQCISNSLMIEYSANVMKGFENVVNSIEKKYDINHPKSLQIKECYNNERIIYENMKTEYNQEICGKLKQLNQRDTDELLSWLTILNLHISYLNFDLY